MTNPIDPNDPNAGSGGNRRFGTGGGSGGPIGDPGDPTGGGIAGGYGRRVRTAHRLSPSPQAPKLRVKRPAAAPGAVAGHSGGHTAQRTTTKAPHFSHLAVGGGLFGASHVGEWVNLKGPFPDVLLARILEQTAVMQNQFGEPVALTSFGSLLPLGHAPRASGNAHPASSRATPHRGVARRALLRSYNAANHTAVVTYSDTIDSYTVSLPVAPTLSDAEITAASVVAITVWSDANPADATITGTVG